MSSQGHNLYIVVFAIYSHGDYFGNVNGPFMQLSFPFQRMLHMKLGIDWTKISEEKMFIIVDDGRTPDAGALPSYKLAS